MSRDEIKLEVAQLTKDRVAPAHGRPTLAAFLVYKNGLEIDQFCPYCNQILSVVKNVEAWTVKCPCGKADKSFRGL